jgi:hypothetical protein
VRQEPTSLLLIGGPGNFKSQAMLHFINAVLARLLDETERTRFKLKPGDYVFNCQFENVYFDGYQARHKVVTFDDFGQNKTVAGTPDNEFMMAIRFINCFAYLLHMAAMEGKGNTYANPWFVFLTSNLDKLQNEAVYSDEALKRRMQFVYTVVPKLEYCLDVKVPLMSKRVDITKLPIGSQGISSIDPRCLEFHERDLSSQNADNHTGRIFTFDEVVEILLDSHSLRGKRHVQYLEELQATMDRYLPSEPQMKFEFGSHLDEVFMESLEQIDFYYYEDRELESFFCYVKLVLDDVNHVEFMEISDKVLMVDEFVRQHSDYPLQALSAMQACFARFGPEFLRTFVAGDYDDLKAFLKSNSHISIAIGDLPVARSRRKIMSYGDKVRESWIAFKLLVSDLLDGSPLALPLKWLRFINEKHPMICEFIAMYTLVCGIQYSILKVILPKPTKTPMKDLSDLMVAFEGGTETFDEYLKECNLMDTEIIDAFHTWKRLRPEKFLELYGDDEPESIGSKVRASLNKSKTTIARSGKQMREAHSLQKDQLV